MYELSDHLAQFIILEGFMKERSLPETVMHKKDFEKFKSSAKNVAQFFKLSAEMNDVLVVDNRLAIPEKLRNAVLNWLHKDHPGQLAMLDAANYIWWPKMHSQIRGKS